MKTTEVKTFELDKDFTVICKWFKTSYGFKHEADLYHRGEFEEFAKCCYYNRTWESFEYESVISDVLNKAVKSRLLTQDEVKTYMDKLSGKAHEEVEAMFGMIAGVAKLGEILCESQKEKNDWKERMIKAGLGDKGLIMPEDWETLSEDEKERRLNNVINEFSK